MLIEREGVLGKSRSIAVSIKESYLPSIDMQAITDLIAENIVRENLNAYQNAVGDIVSYL